MFEKPRDGLKEVYSAGYNLLNHKDATFAALAEDKALQERCRKYGVTHLGGPMLGMLTDRSVHVWIRTLKPASVEVLVSLNGEENVFGFVQSTLASDLVAIVPVDGLQPRTTYFYTVWIDGHAIVLPYETTITTAPPPDTTGKVHIAFGSCYYRWGLGNQELADTISRRNPAAMLLIGAIVAQDRRNHLGMHRADYLLRDFQDAWATLVSQVPVYAT
jgi:alkaline phosphatase D